MLKLDTSVSEKFPALKVLLAGFSGLVIKNSDPALESLKERVSAEIRSKYDIESLKDREPFRTYRDFFWKVGIDPTKTRPASEALVRRVLLGKPFPMINTLVDACNLASMISGVPIAGFDWNKMRGSLRMRFSRPGEEFLGIGMDKQVKMRGIEVVIEDLEGLTAIYPHRDAERTMVTSDTKRLLLLFCGAPGIMDYDLEFARRACTENLKVFCKGEPVSI